MATLKEIKTLSTSYEVVNGICTKCGKSTGGKWYCPNCEFEDIASTTKYDSIFSKSSS